MPLTHGVPKQKWFSLGRFGHLRKWISLLPLWRRIRIIWTLRNDTVLANGGQYYQSSSWPLGKTRFRFHQQLQCKRADCLHLWWECEWRTTEWDQVDSNSRCGIWSRGYVSLSNSFQLNSEKGFIRVWLRNFILRRAHRRNLNFISKKSTLLQRIFSSVNLRRYNRLRQHQIFQKRHLPRLAWDNTWRSANWRVHLAWKNLVSR